MLIRPPLPTALQSTQLSGVEAQVLPVTPKAPHNLPLPPSLPLVHDAPAAWASSLFLQQARPSAAPGPLRGLFLLPGTLLPLLF